MSVSKHVVSATAHVPAGIVLDLQGGSVTLDVARAPFVQGSIRVKNKPGLFEALDPRAHAGTVSLICGDELAGTMRQFSLNIRSVRGGDDNTLEIELASDEALLEDYSPAADIDLLLELNYDETWGTYYGNIKASELTGWVLDQIGGALVAPPSPDPQVEPYWEVKNLAVNPRFFSTLQGAAVGAGASNLTPGLSYLDRPSAMRWVAAAGGSTVYVAGWDMEAGSMTALPISAEPTTGDGLPITSDKWLWVSVDTAEFTGMRSRTLVVQFRDKKTGATVSQKQSDVVYGPFGWEKARTLVRVPAGDWNMAIAVEIGPTTETTLNAWVTDVFIAEVRYPVGTFNGSTLDIDAYEFAWDDVPNDSTSTRYPNAIERLPEAFTWKAGQGGLSFLAPLLQTVGLRLVHNGLGEWTLRHTSHVEPGTTTVAFGQNMIGYELASDLDTFYDAAAVEYTWNIGRGERTRTDYYELAPNPRRVRHMEIALPYPGPGRAENIVRRAQTGGRVARATTVTNWDTTPEQALTIETSIDGHPETTFTDWTERRRNLVPAPRPTAYTGSGWSAFAGLGSVPEAGWIGGAMTGSGTPYIFTGGSERAYAAGEQVTLSVRYRATSDFGAGMHLCVLPHVRAGNTYYRGGAQVTRPVTIGQDEEVVIQWVTPVAIAAGQLDIAIVGSNAAGTGFSSAGAGFGYRATRALIEDGHTEGQFFDGATNPAGVLERTRWLGAANASASVMDTREIVETVWVNDPEVILTGTVGAVTFNLDDDTMTVVARRQEEA